MVTASAIHIQFLNHIVIFGLGLVDDMTYLHIFWKVEIFCCPPEVEADGVFHVSGDFGVDGGVAKDDANHRLGVTVVSAVVLPEGFADHRVGFDVHSVVAVGTCTSPRAGIAFS